MRRFTLKPQNIFEKTAILDEEERKHIANVLRMNIGDRLIASAQDGTDYICEIAEITKSEVILSILEKMGNNSDPTCDITLFQATPKRDKLEFIVQKSTELGLPKIVPFQSKFCISKFDNAKVERLEKISSQATKQCGRSIPLEIENVKTFAEMLSATEEYSAVFFAYEKETSSLEEAINQLRSTKNIGKIAMIIGSEGGFSEEESAKIAEKPNVHSVSLGKRILRLETAVLYLASILVHNLDT